MAPEPSRGGAHADIAPLHSDDVDAEGEEDYEELPQIAHAADIPQEQDDELDEDAEGEEVDDEEEAGEAVGAVKIASGAASDDEDDGDVVVESTDDEGKDDESEAVPDESDEEESEAENEWQAESEGGEEVEAEIADPNRCVFCGEDEEHDPCEEFEEYLACSVCGDNAHRQCARNANNLGPENEADDWRCPNCVHNDLQPDAQEDGTGTTRRRSSAPKITRDLLPQTRGAPVTHSVFNTLIHPDDPMDGSRSLRKRKADGDEQELPIPKPSRKRNRLSIEDDSDDEIKPSEAAASPKVARSVHSDHLTIGLEPENVIDSSTHKTRTGRPKRMPGMKKEEKPPCYIYKLDRGTLVMAFHLDREKLDDMFAIKPQKTPKKRIRDRSRKSQPLPPAEPEISHYPSIQPLNYTTSFYSFPDRDSINSKPYGGILSEAEADTSKTFPREADRRRFEEARQKAEEEWKQKTAAANGTDTSRPVHRMSGPPSKIKCINFGGYEIDTWHAAPYPEEYSRNKVLYICEFCLKYMNTDYVAWRHKLKCPAKHPPGDEIYRDGQYSFFEVDGRKNPVYCQNLCLLAKLFLGSKTLYYDVEPFLFYVMTENDQYGCHFVGYFSKEKRPSSLNNVSCILVLPIHQRKGFGHMLIEFSYLLTRVEEKTGSPEKPLSDMGLVSYRSYWRLILCYHLLNRKEAISITDISEQTGMTPDDIVSALEGLRALVKDPVTKSYALRLDFQYFQQYIEKFEAKNYPKINPDALVWTPYVMGRSHLSNYEEGPPIQTVAQRDEEDEDGEEKAPEEGVQVAQAKAAERERAQSEHLTNGVSPKDDTTSPHEGDAVLTPTDENLLNAQLRPQTPIEAPSKPAPSPRSTRSTPHLPNGFHQSAATLKDKDKENECVDVHPLTAVPPTRFEVFPPIPGSAAARRRPGRPFGSRRRTFTPVRRSTGGVGTSPGNGGASATASALRRTRSKLGETVVNGDDAEEEDEEEDEGILDGVTVTPRGKGKGKAQVEHIQGGPQEQANNDNDPEGEDNADREDDAEDDEDADADADADIDADADADADGDVDAEGEEELEEELDLLQEAAEEDADAEMEDAY